MSKPVSLEARIDVLDMLRGLAIFGILIVNMAMINSPSNYSFVTGTTMWNGIWDQIADASIVIFAQGKFYTLFSFLFGLGFILFIERAEQKGDKAKHLFVRRMLILFIIGVLHACFLWYGDILMAYAIGGLLLLPFRHVKPRTLIVWAFGLLSFFVLMTAISVTTAEGTLDNSERLAVYEQERLTALHAYSQGSFAEVMAQRMKDVRWGISNNMNAFFIFFPLFLLGVYAGKRKFFQNMAQHMRLIRLTWLWGGIIGLGLSVLKYWSLERLDPFLPSNYHNVYTLSLAIGDPALCLFYITSIILIIQHRKSLLMLMPIAAVGRTALSNYLFQSIVCTTLFYSYGFGLYGKVSIVNGLVLSFVIFAVQLVLSNWWLRRYRFGPVEWLWRCMTYGQMITLRK